MAAHEEEMTDLEREFLRLTPADTKQLGANKDAACNCGQSTAVSESVMSEDTPYPETIPLDVGGRKFKVAADVLTAESGFFRRQLSDRFTWAPEPDGSYFLDADPDLFEHLLAFMRRPEVFPLFYAKTDGFNYNLYNRLEAKANYFQIDTLHA